jgi:hypothetical protein
LQDGVIDIGSFFIMFEYGTKVSHGAFDVDIDDDIAQVKEEVSDGGGLHNGGWVFGKNCILLYLR